MWDIAKHRMLDNLSSWLREDVEDKAEEIEKDNREAKDGECKNRKRR